MTSKLQIGTGKTGYTRTRHHPTRTRPDPLNAYPTRTAGRVRVGYG